MKHLFQLKHDMTQQKWTGDLNCDSDYDIKYSHITLQQNQQLHAEQIIQCNNNDALISFSNDKMNEVDEQEIKKSKHNNLNKSCMRIKRSNESVDERNKRLQLDRLRHMTKRKQTKTVTLCGECNYNSLKTKDEIYASVMHRLKLRRQQELQQELRTQV